MSPVVDLAYPFQGALADSEQPCDRGAQTRHDTAAGRQWGWRELAGNHVLIESDDGVVIAIRHLRRGSVGVHVGQRLRVGEELGLCGNSGNSTEPHVHLQAMDRADVLHASCLPITFGGSLPRNGEIIDVA